ncbi:MAG: RHS repeat domain-containing protein [Alphaproteobacteria bacterium]
MESIDISSSTIGTYSYNANNQRTKKVTGAGTTHYVYGMGGLLYGEYDGSGALIREYIYLNGEPIAQIDNVSSSDVLTYLHTDHLGTPRAGSNTSGASVWSWDSDAFGNGAPTGTQTVNLRFAGQYWDDESGLHYNWNRYYAPETGRYISSDPIGLSGGLNTFAYVSANPVMFIDPEGLQFMDPEDWSEGLTNGCNSSMPNSFCPDTLPCIYCSPKLDECLGSIWDRSLDYGSCGMCIITRGVSKNDCAMCAGRAVRDTGCRAKHCVDGEKDSVYGAECKPKENDTSLMCKY